MHITETAATTGIATDGADLEIGLASRAGPWRLAACAVGVAACLPYLTLKALWLSGHLVGWTAAGGKEALLATGPTAEVANGATASMDLIAVLLLLALTLRPGRRAPAWLLLLPLWVATGLLAPIALGFPAGLLASAGQTSGVLGRDNGLAEWVYGLVYTGFTVQALAILAAFALYARARWSWVFRFHLGEIPRGATYAFQRLIVGGATVALIPYLATFTAWGLGAWLPVHERFAQTPAQRAALLVVAGLALVALVGMYSLVTKSHRVVDWRLWPPLVLAWVGVASTFASSLYRVVWQLSGLGGDPVGAAALAVLAGTLAGLLLGVAGLLLLLEASPGPSAAAQRPDGATCGGGKAEGDAEARRVTPASDSKG